MGDRITTFAGCVMPIKVSRLGCTCELLKIRAVANEYCCGLEPMHNSPRVVYTPLLTLGAHAQGGLLL